MGGSGGRAEMEGVILEHPAPQRIPGASEECCAPRGERDGSPHSVWTRGRNTAAEWASPIRASHQPRCEDTQVRNRERQRGRATQRERERLRDRGKEERERERERERGGGEGERERERELEYVCQCVYVSLDDVCVCVCV